jgi:hypothetical protein
VTGEKRVPRDRAEASRRAAALFQHWRRDDLDGVYTILDEIDFHDDLEITKLIAAFMDIGSNAILAARDGNEDRYLDGVLSAAALDEVLGEA